MIKLSKTQRIAPAWGGVIAARRLHAVSPVIPLFR
jgi:hypothetical protein